MVNMISMLEPIAASFDCVSVVTHLVEGVETWPAIYDGRNVHELRDSFVWVQKAARTLARGKKISEDTLTSIMDKTDVIIDELDSTSKGGVVRKTVPAYSSTELGAKTRRIQSLVVQAPIRLGSNKTSSNRTDRVGSNKTSPVLDTKVTSRTAIGAKTASLTSGLKTASGSTVTIASTPIVLNKEVTVERTERDEDLQALFGLSLVPEETKRALAAKMGITEQELRQRILAQKKGGGGSSGGAHAKRWMESVQSNTRAAKAFSESDVVGMMEDRNSMLDAAKSEIQDWDQDGRPVTYHKTLQRGRKERHVDPEEFTRLQVERKELEDEVEKAGQSQRGRERIQVRLRSREKC